MCQYDTNLGEHEQSSTSGATALATGTGCTWALQMQSHEQGREA